MGYIYKISNDFNDKVYIGQTIQTVEKRWQDHLYSAINSDRYLYKSIRKHGVEHFKIEEIEKCANDKLNEREVYYISKFDSYNNGYNLTPGGDGSILRSKDELQKIYSLADSGLSISKIASSMNVSNACISNILFNILDFKRDAFHLYKNTVENIPKLSLIGMFSYDDILLRVFNSSGAAATYISTIVKTNTKLHTIRGNICYVIKNYNRVIYGHKWKSIELCDDSLYIESPYLYTYKNSSDLSKYKRPILQFDLNGNFIKRFESLTDAANEFALKYNVDHRIATGYIARTYSKNKNRRNQIKGYIYRPEDEVGKNYNKIDVSINSIGSGGKKKSVVKLNLDNTFIDEYVSISEAGKANNISGKCISDVVNPNRPHSKTLHKFKWMYLEDYQKLHPEYVSKFKK